MELAAKLQDIMNRWTLTAAPVQRKLGSLRTGFRHLDHAMGGMEPGELVVVAARPSIGLSLFLMQTALALAKTSRVLLASRCVRPDEVVPRLLAIESGIPLSRVGKRVLVASTEVPIVEEARLALARLDLWLLGGLFWEEVLQGCNSAGGARPTVVLYDSVRLQERRPGRKLRDMLRDSQRWTARERVATVVGVTLTHESQHIEPFHSPTLLDLGEAATVPDTLVFLDRPSFYDPSPAPIASTVSKALSVLIPRSCRGSNRGIQFDFEPEVPRFGLE